LPPRKNPVDLHGGAIMIESGPKIGSTIAPGFPNRGAVQPENN
jgi:hypothetical protein